MAIRFGFCSDIHLQPGDCSADGYRRCLRDAAAQNLDFLVTGGDHLWDSMAANLARTEALWDYYHSIVASEPHPPIEPVIGNHDVWGIDRRSGATGGEPLFGKAMALKQLGLESRYRTFVRGTWRFIMLDSVFIDPNRVYNAYLDDEQKTWLVGTLEANDAPNVVILSHIPIVSVTPFFFGQNEATGDWRVPGPWMSLDARWLRDLFLEHREVRLCLAGHMHQVDRVDYLGVTYMLCGSVSGDIWEGPFERCDPAYSVVTLHEDGRFDRELRKLVG